MKKINFGKFHGLSHAPITQAVLMDYFCGLDYLLMVRRNALLFAYCLVDDEDLAFVCLILFLFCHSSPVPK